jgi:hypothetical protein
VPRQISSDDFGEDRGDNPEHAQPAWNQDQQVHPSGHVPLLNSMCTGEPTVSQQSGEPSLSRSAKSYFDWSHSHRELGHCQLPPIRPSGPIIAIRMADQGGTSAAFLRTPALVEKLPFGKV